MKKISLPIIFVLVFVLAAASIYEIYKTSGMKDNKLYVPKDSEPVKDIAKIDSALNLKAASPFYEFGSYTADNEDIRIPLTLSPDKKSMYFMTPVPKKSGTEFPRTIKGSAEVPVNISKLDLSSQKSITVATVVPFVSTVKWSTDGTLIGFSGGGRLTLFNDSENKLMMNEELKGEDIRFFGWSPDSKKLYGERSNLPNSIILFLDTRRKAAPHEVKEVIFYKHTIDKDFYYGTKQTLNPSDVPGSSRADTVIADRAGNTIRSFSDAVFRDAFDTSLLVTDKNLNLKLIKDINAPSDSRLISSDRTYDTKFISGGGFIYTTIGKDIESNSFELHICSSNGDEISSHSVPGSHIFLSPDGKSGYISGENSVIRIDFSKNTPLPFIGGVPGKVNLPAGDMEEVFKTLRGGLHVISKYLMTSEKDSALASKYIDNSLLAALWKASENNDISNRSNQIAQVPLQNYDVTMKLKEYTEYIEKGDKFVTASASIDASALWVEDLHLEMKIRLVKRQNRWYIMSFNFI